MSSRIVENVVGNDALILLAKLKRTFGFSYDASISLRFIIISASLGFFFFMRYL